MMKKWKNVQKCVHVPIPKGFKWMWSTETESGEICLMFSKKVRDTSKNLIHP